MEQPRNLGLSDGDFLGENGEPRLTTFATGVAFSSLGNFGFDAFVDVTDGQWHHVMAVWDYNEDNPSASVGKMYVNGVDSTSSGSYLATFPPEPNNVLTMGLNPGDQWRGMMDELVIYDRVLSPTEVVDVMMGRYGRNDLIVQSGAELSYEATITNTLVTQAVDGFLFAETEYLSPTVETPAVYFPFEQEDYVTTLSEGISGGGYGASCIEDGSCPNLDGAGQNVNGNSSGVQFNNNADYLTIPNISQGIVLDPSFPSNSDEKQTIAFWIRPTARPAAGEIAMILDTDTNAEGVPANGAVDIAMDSTGHLLVNFGAPYGEPCCGAGASDPAVLRSTNPLPLNNWRHVVISYQRLSFGQPLTRIYINQVDNGTDRPLEIAAPKSLTIGPGRLRQRCAGQ